MGDLIYVATTDLIQTAWKKPGKQKSVEIAVKDLKERLGYDYASPLERLNIDEVAIPWVRMSEVQERHTSKHHYANLTPKESEYEDRLLSNAQKRYTRALESLARLRRLLRGTAYIQINIAQDGAKQVNVVNIPQGRRKSVRPGSTLVPSCALAPNGEKN
jgi:hypothetical protein